MCCIPNLLSLGKRKYHQINADGATQIGLTNETDGVCTAIAKAEESIDGPTSDPSNQIPFNSGILAEIVNGTVGEEEPTDTAEAERTVDGPTSDPSNQIPFNLDILAEIRRLGEEVKILREQKELQSHQPTTQAPGKKRYLQTEKLIRQELEAMLNIQLPKQRPVWLRNPCNGAILELDMYNVDHKLAFEYDGSQHMYFTPFFHQTEENFKYRQALDRKKDELCKQHGVLLIRIPYSSITMSGNVTEQLWKILRNNGVTEHLSVRPRGVDGDGSPVEGGSAT